MSESPTTFGSNVWLVDEMYRRYREAPESVSAAWRDFFSDYEPTGIGSPGVTTPPPVAEPLATAPARTERAAQPARVGEDDRAERVPMIGAPARIAEAMEASMAVPTATSVRSIPAMLLEVNRRIINNQLGRLGAGRKVSFTHLIGWAMVRAMADHPVMNSGFEVIDGKPHALRYRSINLGLAVDVTRNDGSHTLLVPNIKGADAMDFREFWLAYEEVIHRVRSGQITPEDFAGTTCTLTNPGTIGTVQSVPRLMQGQGVIVGVGALAYPPEYQGADPATIARLGVGRTINITSTYDHRVIQGAESGAFLGRIHELLLGESEFYDEVFQALGTPYVPARWAVDDNPAWGSDDWAAKQARVFRLINMYRVRGHLIADLDPLRMTPPSIHPELDPITHGLTIWDLNRKFAVGGLGGHKTLELGVTLGLLRDAYCRTVGVEYMHIQTVEEKDWIQSHVEVPTPEMSREEKLRILHKLNQAEAFERFLGTKYLGAKRFGLEGSESMIPALDTVLSAAADAGMQEAVIGMAHRGRLNVLANIVGKSYAQIFREFEGTMEMDTLEGSGDVKYHLGATGNHVSEAGNSLRVEVAANPSHLEAVDPVLEGLVRAKQDAIGAGSDDAVLPILVHGDAAFAGQGVVFETINLSQLPGYYTGGTVHLVVNNQVGFTTAAAEARSSFYATDVAKAVQAPIFHVNGDDPEAVARVAHLAFEYRRRFHKDVVLDLLCYRRLGHNEADEPSFTQPLMYRVIDKHRSVRKLYLEQLVHRGEITLEEGEELLEEFEGILAAALAETRGPAPAPASRAAPVELAERPSSIDREVADRIHDVLSSPPPGFTVHPKLIRVIEGRRELYADGLVDWALAEALAYGSLAMEGSPVRLAGEDSSRGTFSHRHAVMVDYENGSEWMPLSELHPDQAPIHIVDSMLSEFAALGFEYGYSVATPEALVMWEAQFGDFANGAQVIIDQFVVPGEDKWAQRSGLVIMLPHGFEGQGPEHSSARIERFLQSAAEDNIRVVVPSTAGSYFHALRRQVTSPMRKPLVLFTPKSLLRTRESYSNVEVITGAAFGPVLADGETGAARRVVLCSGKIYYDLLTERRARGVEDVALVRLEQLFPFETEAVREAVDRHGPDAELVWAQEEPSNMGAWSFVAPRLQQALGRRVALIGRRESPSPATGSHNVHLQEQQELVDKALA